MAKTSKNSNPNVVVNICIQGIGVKWLASRSKLIGNELHMLEIGGNRWLFLKVLKLDGELHQSIASIRAPMGYGVSLTEEDKSMVLA